MDLSLGTRNVPSIPGMAVSREAVSVPVLPAAVSSSSMILTAQAAQNVLMPNAHAQIQVASIFVARRLIPPARYTGPDREEKKIGEFLRRVKVAKSEAAGQQTQSR